MALDTKTQLLIPLFEEFLKHNKQNKRTQQGGKTLKAGTKRNYTYLLMHLKTFQISAGFELRVTKLSSNKRAFKLEKNYYTKFYQHFTDYLYNDCGHFDNYVGSNIKQLKTFFGWLNREKGLNIGEFYKAFYVWKEDIQIIVLTPEQLNELIHSQELENKLSKKLKWTKDIFVFGCTVGLRVGDLLNLKKTDIEVQGDKYYLNKRSKKTNTLTRIKLPAYAINILLRNKTRGSNQFRKITAYNLGKNIKELAADAGWGYACPKVRHRRGVPVAIYSDDKRKTHYKFCEMVSTHTMRRTAITTLLNLGMDESDVRRISGHSPGSKEFYKYVKYSQQKLDDAADLAFEKLVKKHLKSA